MMRLYLYIPWINYELIIADGYVNIKKWYCKWSRLTPNWYLEPDDYLAFKHVFYKQIRRHR